MHELYSLLKRSIGHIGQFTIPCKALIFRNTSIIHMKLYFQIYSPGSCKIGRLWFFRGWLQGGMGHWSVYCTSPKSFRICWLNNFEIFIEI